MTDIWTHENRDGDEDRGRVAIDFLRGRRLLHDVVESASFLHFASAAEERTVDGFSDGLVGKWKDLNGCGCCCCNLDLRIQIAAWSVVGIAVRCKFALSMDSRSIPPSAMLCPLPVDERL